MSPDPTFSIVIPTFNRAASLGRAVDSVLRQELEDFELIVIDDGSTDETASVLASRHDGRLRSTRQENRGRSAARNRGLQIAAGSFVAFLDSDDAVDPSWLSELQSAIGARTGVVCCGVKRFDEGTGGVLAVDYPRNLGPVYFNQVGLFTAGCFSAHRGLLLSVGGYREELAFAENTELALRLIPACLKRSLQIYSVSKALVLNSQRPLRDRLDPTTIRSLLDGANYILEHHGKHYLSHSPSAYANYHAIAGVNAFRLAYRRRARHHFLQALRANPRRPIHAFRLLLSLAPWLASLRWRPIDQRPSECPK